MFFLGLYALWYGQCDGVGGMHFSLYGAKCMTNNKSLESWPSYWHKYHMTSQPDHDTVESLWNTIRKKRFFDMVHLTHCHLGHAKSITSCVEMVDTTYSTYNATFLKSQITPIKWNLSKIPFSYLFFLGLKGVTNSIWF